MKLEEKIAMLRKSNGWSQEELGFRLDVSRQAVSKWEMGDSVPDLDKILKMSELFGCTTDYLLKDEGAPVEIASTESVEAQLAPKAEYIKAHRQVCDEEGESYLSLVKKQSWKIAFGVAICILSPICMFILIALSTIGYPITEEAAGSTGVAVLLAICAVGVTFILVGGIPLSPYGYLEKEEIAISERLEKLVREKRTAESGAITIAIAVGVGLCILSTFPLMLSVALFGENDASQTFALAALFPFIAIGVFLFIKFGMVNGSYQKLLQEGDYTVKRKVGENASEVFAGIYWCLMVAIYLGVSFWTMKWHITWILWPIAGVTFALIQQIFIAMANRNKKEK